jgi:hypothetical protein
MSRVAAPDRWYRQPVLWLGGLILLTSLAGGVSMIVLGARYADPPLDGAGAQIMKMPLTRADEPVPAPSP